MMNLGLMDPAFMGSLGGTTLWTPAQITTALWLDAADASTITTVSGAVSQWNDKSGNSRNGTQSVSTARPAYTSSGLNGKNVITFDGNNDFLALPSLAGVRTVSVFAVASFASVTANLPILDESGINAYGGGLHLRLTSSGTIRFWGQDAVPLTDTSSTISQNTATLIGAIESSGSRTIWINGTSRVTATFSTVNSRVTADPRIGSSALLNQWMNGYIAEIVLVGSAIATETRGQIEGYLAHSWGLTANLPAGHPYKTAPPYI